MICIVQNHLQCPAPNAGHAGHPNNQHFRVPGLKFGEALIVMDKNQSTGGGQGWRL